MAQSARKRKQKSAPWRLLQLASAAALVTLFLAGGMIFFGRTTGAPPDLSAALPAPTLAQETDKPFLTSPTPTQEALHAVKPSLPSPSPALPQEPEVAQAVSSDAYDYSLPVPEGEAVDQDWYADAAFIGDSRTDGLFLYSGLKEGTKIAYKGLTVQSAQDKDLISTPSGKKTAVQALAQGSYAKVYLMLGVNELGWNRSEQYEEACSTLIDAVKAAQPDAQVYLQALIPVTTKKSNSSYINNPRILVYNDILKKLAEEKQVYLLDVWSAFADETGALPAGDSTDGVHLTKASYQRWLEYLNTHTVPQPQ